MMCPFGMQPRDLHLSVCQSGMQLECLTETHSGCMKATFTFTAVVPDAEIRIQPEFLIIFNYLISINRFVIG